MGADLRFGQTRILIANTRVRPFLCLIEQVRFGSIAAARRLAVWRPLALQSRRWRQGVH